MSGDESAPPPKRAKHFHDAPPSAGPDHDTAAEIDRSHRLAASSKILLRMSAKKGAKGRASDVSGHNFVVDRNETQDETRTQETTNLGEAVSLENHQCIKCHNNDQLEQSMKNMDNRMSKVEGEIAELRADFQGLRELLLERLPPAPLPTAHVAPAPQPTPSSTIRNIPRYRAPEGVLPPTTRKRTRDEDPEQIAAAEKRREREEQRRIRMEQEMERRAKRAEAERARRARKIAEAKAAEEAEASGRPQQTLAPMTPKAPPKKSRPSRPLPSGPVFDMTQTPRFDKFSLTQQIIALAERDKAPETPGAPSLRLPPERVPHAVFLLISESLPTHSRASLTELRALWGGTSARRVGEWLPIKMPYLHAAMNFALVGPYLTTVRVGHRNFVMDDPKWPREIEEVQVPKLTTSIMAAAVGLLRDASSNSGAFARDACIICDQQSPDTPQNWRRWLDKKTYDPSTLPISYQGPMDTMCGIPFASFLKDIRTGDAKKKR
ncbi:hypothetical protein RhiJN_06646 [Ceratobasidium sp. AG-Ba]|nr:hypothetical protein RhiJN_06646 [Ceratobasidium sp. AG-Ba]